MRRLVPVVFGLISLLPAALARGQDAMIRIDAARELQRVSRLLTGACIEDVNHEIYGGLYSQMIFGESFQEPAPPPPIEGFKAYQGEWKLADGTLTVSPGQGNKLVADAPTITDGQVSVEIRFDDRARGNAGLILHVSKPRNGANAFFGYEISLDPSLQIVRLGRHRNNWEHIRDVPCEVKTGQWLRLQVRLEGATIRIAVDDEERFTYEDRDNRSLQEGQVGLRQWERNASFRNLQAVVDGKAIPLPFVAPPANAERAVSGMWRGSQSGSAVAEYQIAATEPFVGVQCQRMRFVSGEGAIGIDNRGLNRWGLHFQEGKEYEGVLYAQADSPCDLRVGAETDQGAVLDETKLHIASPGWERVEFTLKPRQTVANGRFAIKLTKPGAVSLGYVSLQPGPWGRFKDLPVRRDVAELMQKQGITILRYGGSMINNDRYRWKNMIGPRAERPPYQGLWYRYSTNGWGIIDFMDFCEAAGFEYVPAFSMSESPEDLADFVRYSTDASDSPWGRRRAGDGHPRPYRLRFMELGNEERVDEEFAARFAARAKAIWDVDPGIQLVVGDFVYDHNITDPMKVTGAASGITNLKGQQKILQFASQSGHEVWFDVHVWTGGPRPNASFDAMFTFIDALEKLADGAKFKVLTFEFNANNHDQRRALANALAINVIERDGRLPIATSANGLQPDGQNDNGWDQGLLFLSPARVWLQPPGYVTQLYAQHHQPRLVHCTVEDESKELDCNAKRSADGRALVCHVVNLAPRPKTARIRLDGFVPTEANAQVTTLSAGLDAVNTEANPANVTPRVAEWQHRFASGAGEFTFAPSSLTVIVVR